MSDALDVEHGDARVLAAVIALARDAVQGPAAWTALGALKAGMNAAGFWFQMRDAGNDENVDVIWFWAKDWRVEGRFRGLKHDEAAVAAEAAKRALEALVARGEGRG